MKTKIASKNIDGFQIFYREQTVDSKVLDHSFENDIFYRAIPDLSRNCNSVVDIGAHIGTFSLKTSRLFPNAKILAIEAFSETFEILKRNIEENNVNNIVCINKAISDKNSTESLFLDEENWGHSITNNNNTEYEVVASSTLESLLIENKMDSCDLLKFNCEGAEFRILLSTDKSVLNKIKMMIILYHEDMERSYSRMDIEKHLKESGFITRYLYKREKRGWIIAKNKKYYNKYLDFISRIIRGIGYRLKNF